MPFVNHRIYRNNNLYFPLTIYTMSETKNQMQSDSTLVADARMIIEQGRMLASQPVASTMIATYWQVGKRIVEEEQQGKVRAEYGKQMIKHLAEQLTHGFDNGFSERYLRSFRQFCMMTPDYEIWKSRFPNLIWTHIFHTLRLKDDAKALWHLEQASAEMWSVRTLNRNIGTQYYERHLQLPEVAAERCLEEEPLRAVQTAVRLGRGRCTEECQSGMMIHQ